MTSPRHAKLQQQSIQSAIAFHRQGQLKEAERLYNDVLKRERNQFDALHLLGLLRYQQGRYSDAQLLIASALTANSGSVAALTNYGLALDKLGLVPMAIGLYIGNKVHADMTREGMLRVVGTLLMLSGLMLFLKVAI